MKKHRENVPKWVKQGFGCCDIMELKTSIAALILRGLKDFQKNKGIGYPESFKTQKNWDNFIKEIVKDLDKYLKNNCDDFDKYDELEKKAHEAVKRFAEEWGSFWI